MLQTHRSDCIAGKPAPTTAHKPCANAPNMPMWEPACRRCFRQTRATASLASQLPQLHTSAAPMHQYAHVGAGLPAMLQTNPGACIAGKPAPTSAHKPWANAPICPCGSRLAGDASDKPGRLHRWQASSHKCTQTMGQSWANTPRGSRLAGDGCPGCMLSLPASAQRGVYVHQ